MATAFLSHCPERSRCDWILAVSLDLLTLAWVVTLVAWWL